MADGQEGLGQGGDPYETDEGIADFHAAGRHSYITGLFRAGVSLPTVRKLARHVELADQAQAIQALECQWFGNVSGVPGCLPLAQKDAAAPKKAVAKKRRNPGGDQGYDASCHDSSPAVAEERKVEAAEIE